MLFSDFLQMVTSVNRVPLPGFTARMTFGSPLAALKLTLAE